MAILESLIISGCVGLTGDVQLACQKSLQAAIKETVTTPTGCVALTEEDKAACKKIEHVPPKQASLESIANSAEEKYSKKAESTVRYMVGNTTFDYVGATAFAVKTVQDKSVSFGLPTLGLCNNAHVQVGQDKSDVRLEWKF
jgi:hypothetical protein